MPSIGYIFAEAAHALMEFTADCIKLESEGYKFVFAVIPRMMVQQARELAAEKALELNCDYLCHGRRRHDPPPKPP